MTAWSEGAAVVGAMAVVAVVAVSAVALGTGAAMANKSEELSSSQAHPERPSRSNKMPRCEGQPSS